MLIMMDIWSVEWRQCVELSGLSPVRMHGIILGTEAPSLSRHQSCLLCRTICYWQQLHIIRHHCISTVSSQKTILSSQLCNCMVESHIFCGFQPLFPPLFCPQTPLLTVFQKCLKQNRQWTYQHFLKHQEIRYRALYVGIIDYIFITLSLRL